jgi:hypothetical protein
MTDSSIFDGLDKPKKCCGCHKKQKQTVLWTFYHTLLALELGVIIFIEGVELLMRINGA